MKIWGVSLSFSLKEANTEITGLLVSFSFAGSSFPLSGRVNPPNGDTLVSLSPAEKTAGKTALDFFLRFIGFL